MDSYLEMFYRIHETTDNLSCEPADSNLELLFGPLEDYFNIPPAVTVHDFDGDDPDRDDSELQEIA